MSDNLAINSQGGDDSVSAAEGIAAVHGDDNQNPDINAEGTEGEGGDTENLDGNTQSLEEEMEEVERDGKKYRVPKALKGELLMHADYTRKTQEVAEQRRAIEAQRAEVENKAKLHGEIIKEAGRVAALEESLDAFRNYNWAALQAQNPEQAQSLWFQYQQVEAAYGKAKAELQTKQDQKRQDEQRSYATRVQESLSVLSRDIKDFSPALADKITAYAVTEFGFTPQELAQKIDPREIKLAHAAMQGAAAVKELAALKKQLASKNLQPVKTVGSGGSARAGQKDPDKMTMDEWVAYETNRMKAKKG